MDFVKYLVFLLSWAIMLAVIIFAPDTGNAVAPFYMAVVGAFLGIDIAIMISTTKTLPKGEFKPLKTARYLTVALTTMALAGACIYAQTQGASVSAALSTFVSGLFIVAAMYIGALEGNKLVTNIGPEEEK